jgi:hypothetical protein
MSAEVAVKSSSISSSNTIFKLDHTVIGTDIYDSGNSGEAPITILAKPSQHIEAYFESTKGLVEGVDKVFYSNKIILQEIGNAAKRSAGDTTTGASGSIKVVKINTPALSVYGLDANSGVPATTTDWIDSRAPSFKIGYDETNQKLSFDAVNGDLGKGTGIGFDSFTVYSQKLDS